MAISIQLITVLLMIEVLIMIGSEKTTWKLIFGALLIVPTSAQGLISGVSYDTGGIMNLSLVGYITILVSTVLLNKHRIRRREVQNTIICFSIILMIRIIGDGADFVSNKLFDNYLLPMLLSVLIVTYLTVDAMAALFRYAYKIVLVGAIIACIEFVYGRSLLFHNYYLNTVPWYVDIYRSAQYVAFRSTSLFGHPLTGMIYYIFGTVYVLNSGSFAANKIRSYIELAILAAGIYTTNSRAGFLVFGIYLAYYLFKNRKFGILALVSIIGGIMLLTVDWESLYYLIFARDRGGSSLMVRVRAIASVSKLPVRTILLGEGYNNTSKLLGSLGFSGNVEISFFIILLENGVIGFCAWAASILLLYHNGKGNSCKGNADLTRIINGTLFCTFVAGATSNSFGDPGTLNYLIYIMLACSSVLKYRGSESSTELNNRMHKHKKRFE